MLIKNGLVFLPEEGFVKKDIVFSGEKIIAIADAIEEKEGEEVE